MPSKINENNLKEAEAALKQVAEAVKNYEVIWQLLNVQEKTLSGGLVINISCPWGEFSFMGILSEPPLTSALIATLANQAARPVMPPGKKVIDSN